MILVLQRRMKGRLRAQLSYLLKHGKPSRQLEADVFIQMDRFCNPPLIRFLVADKVTICFYPRILYTA